MYIFIINSFSKARYVIPSLQNFYLKNLPFFHVYLLLFFSILLIMIFLLIIEVSDFQTTLTRIRIVSNFNNDSKDIYIYGTTQVLPVTLKMHLLRLMIQVSFIQWEFFSCKTFLINFYINLYILYVFLMVNFIYDICIFPVEEIHQSKKLWGQQYINCLFLTWKLSKIT